ncbi:MAG: murein biosynthesis integral membrane protein MurJ [Nitrospirota bacterium]
MSEQASVTRAAWSMSVVTSISRVLGFVRLMVIAKIFGAGMVTDAFFQAFRISNIFRQLLAEGSMSAAFIPVFTEYFHTKSKEEARELASTVFYLLLFICIGVVALGMAFSPEVVSSIAHGWINYPEKFALTVRLTRIMFPYILFVGLSAVIMGVLNSLGSFAAPAAAPVMLNLSMIGFALWVCPHMKTPIVGLALGVIFGGILQLLIQLPPLKRRGMLFPFVIRPRDPGVKKIGRLTVPVIGSQAATQINIFITSLIATYLPGGSVSYLLYATQLFQFPHGIFGISIATAVLPSMSRQSAVGDYEGMKETLSFGLRYILFIMVPSMVGLIVLRIPITSLLFQRGTFTYTATLNVAYALMFYSMGLWAYSGVRILNAAFYSLHDTRTPLLGAFVAVFVNAALSLLLMGPLKQGGLALATATASAVNMFLLLFLFRMRMGRIGARKILKSALKTALASAVMGVICYFIARGDLWAMNGHTVRKGAIVGAAIAAGLAVYFSILYLLKSEELSFIINTYKRKVKAK